MGAGLRCGSDLVASLTALASAGLSDAWMPLVHWMGEQRPSRRILERMRELETERAGRSRA